MFGLFLNFRLGPPPQGPNGHPQLLQQQQQQQQQLMSNSNSSNNKFMLHNNQLLLDTKSETKQMIMPFVVNSVRWKMGKKLEFCLETEQENPPVFKSVILLETAINTLDSFWFA